MMNQLLKGNWITLSRNIPQISANPPHPIPTITRMHSHFNIDLSGFAINRHGSGVRIEKLLTHTHVHHGVVYFVGLTATRPRQFCVFK
jgi:hypothetical protein